MTPKLTALRSVPQSRGPPLGLGAGWVAGEWGPAHAHLPHQEEIRIDSTVVFVDPYEEADAQVRRGWGDGCARSWPGSVPGPPPDPALEPASTRPPQIAEERRKTQLEAAAPESTAKSSQPPQGSQGPQAYRQGVGKYISPAVT